MMPLPPLNFNAVTPSESSGSVAPVYYGAVNFAPKQSLANTPPILLIGAALAAAYIIWKR